MIYSSSPFSRFAKSTARATGHPAAFMAAALIVVVWGVTGPIFKFSNTWQLVINSGTPIVTFLMVFLIQNTQNRDSHARPTQTRRADSRRERRAQCLTRPRRP
jgi:low affinity Fe/Cu permease